MGAVPSFDHALNCFEAMEIVAVDAAIAHASDAADTSDAAAVTNFGRAFVNHRLHRRRIGRHRPGMRARTEQGGSRNENGGRQ